MVERIAFISFGARTLWLESPAIRGTDVAVLQTLYDVLLRLADPTRGPIGSPVTVDGVYGPSTAEAVRAVQMYFGLTADGVAGPQIYRLFGQGVGPFVPYGGPRFGSRVMTEGDQGGDVAVLQNRLNCFRYARPLRGPADGFYGSSTRSAVAAFQAAAGVGENGEAGLPTLEALWQLTHAGGRDLTAGDQGIDVAWLQCFLANTSDPATGRPFYGGPVSGHFGGETLAAVRAFQSVAGLPDDGVVAATTYRQIGLRNPHAAPGPASSPAR
jgi:peptidoglycan hydrolase-like protein with peptidoglycan-binding domain